MLIRKILVYTFYLFIAGLPLASLPATAQKKDKKISIDALTINDGLSQGMVVRIFQDRFGFMWFATLDGLNRYDGYQFTVYRHNPRDKTSITKSYVQSLFEDSKGRLWIGTVSGGLDLFDRETETFIHINKQEGNGKGLADGSVKSIAEDKYGNIWVHVSDKLEKITIENNNAKPVERRISVRHVQVPFHSDISFLTVTTAGRIYYVDGGEGIIYRLEDEHAAKWSVALRIGDTLPDDNGRPATAYRIVQLVEDTAAKKLYVCHEEGITGFNEKTGKQDAVLYNEFFKGSDAPLRAVLDKTGVLWFSGRSKLLMFDTHTRELKSATAGGENSGRLLQSTYSVYTDRSGLLWIGTAGYGILKRNIRSEFFHRTPGGAGYAIYEAANGDILLGNGKAIQQVFNRETGQVTNVSAMSKTEAARLTEFLFLPLVKNKEGAWFVAEDRLHYRDSITKKDIEYALPVSRNSEYVDLIQCKLSDSRGHIWLGTASGLLRFGIADKKWTVFKNNPNDPGSVSSNVIFSLCADPLQPAKYMWIGTGGGGLNRMDMGTGSCKSYSIKQGLPNDVIYGILNDDAGNLWMSTNKGLSCLNLSTQTFRNFDHKDGLQSNEFNRGAYCKTKDGALFFGGVSGFNYFYPKDLTNNNTVPQVVITGLKIRNKPVNVGEERSPLSKTIYLAQKLTLPYEQNFVSFQFAAMDFTDPEKNMYRYKLTGFDENWISSGTENTATYSNLDPGSYTFFVQGSNNDGTWNEKGTFIGLTILPPWYMTWWFYTLVVLAVLFASYSFYKNRLAQALKLQAIRDRIAGDLHDEVGSNLSNIYIFSNVARHKANDETAPLLQKIGAYTRQSMDAMNDIVWMINTRNDRFENIMVRMRTLAVESSEALDCKLQLDFDESLNEVKLNMEERKNFYLIYKEALNNIAKYAGCKSMQIDMKLEQKTVTLTIKDNGKGFDAANSTHGNGLYNMKKRADLLKGNLAVTSKPGEGTEVQLSFKI